MSIIQPFDTSSGDDLDGACTTAYLEEARQLAERKMVEIDDFLNDVDCDGLLSITAESTSFTNTVR